MSKPIESLEEMLRSLKAQPERLNYVEIGPSEPIASPQEMIQHLEKAKRIQSSVAASPAPKAPPTPMASKQIDVSGMVPERAQSQPIQPEVVAPTSQPSFADMISQIQAASKQAPREDIYGSVEREMESIRDQKSKIGNDSWIDLLGMAIPTLVGARYGQLGAGAIPAGEYGIARGKEMRDREAKLEDMLTQLASKRALALGRQKEAADPVKTFLGRDGKPYPLRLSLGNQLGLPEFKEGSFQPLETAEGLTAFDKKAGKIGETFAQAPKKDDKADREKRLAEQFAIEKQLQAKDKLRGSQEFKVQSARAEATDTALKVLEQRNPIGDVGVTTIFAKGIFGDVGNITQDERRAFEGNPMLVAAFNRLYEKYIKTGKLEESDRYDLQSLAYAMNQSSTARLQELARNEIESLKSVGIDPSGVINPIMQRPPVTKPVAPVKKSSQQKPGQPYRQNKPVKDMDEKELDEYLKAKGAL
jgi:hypothetical protein